jgi:4-hydroxy-tetrahydrodipicolinate synthase
MISLEQAREGWRGVLAPLVTPFKESGELDLTTLRCNIEWLVERGARQGNTVLLAVGSGGDFPMMNLDERKQAIELIAKTVDGRVPIIAGVQSLDIRDTIALCQLSESLGIEGVQISGPFYYDGRPDDVSAWFNEVARHTQIGFAVYNNWYTGYDMPLELIESLLQLPNSVAVKWASPRVDVFETGIRRLLSRSAVINNTFNTIMGHMLGSRCFVSHWANFYPEWCWGIWGLLEAGDYQAAQVEFDRVMVPYQELVDEIACRTAGEGVFVRAAMAAAGLDGGFSRLPSRDSVVTPSIESGFRSLLASVRAGEQVDPAGPGPAQAG